MNDSVFEQHSHGKSARGPWAQSCFSLEGRVPRPSRPDFGRRSAGADQRDGHHRVACFDTIISKSNGNPNVSVEQQGSARRELRSASPPTPKIPKSIKKIISKRIFVCLHFRTPCRVSFFTIEFKRPSSLLSQMAVDLRQLQTASAPRSLSPASAPAVFGSLLDFERAHEVRRRLVSGLSREVMM